MTEPTEVIRAKGTMERLGVWYPEKAKPATFGETVKSDD